MSEPFEKRIDLKPPCSDWFNIGYVPCRENSTDAGSEDDHVGTEVEWDAILESPAQVYVNYALAVVAHARDKSIVTKNIRREVNVIPFPTRRTASSEEALFLDA